MSSFLTPPKCVKDTEDIIIIINSEKEGRCYSREELLNHLRDGRDSLSDHTFDKGSYELVRNFPDQIFQEYQINGKWYLRSINKTLEEYLAGLVEESTLSSEFSEILLGEGTFGRVLQHGDRRIVSKVVKVDGNIMVTDESQLIELAVPALLNNSKCCVSKTFHVDVGCRNIEMIMPKYDSDMRKELRKRSLDTKNVLYQLLQGLYYAYSYGVIHRDLKFENVLMNGDDTFISDWGKSFFIPYFENAIDRHVYTLTYRAPEVFIGRDQHTTAADVYALGIMGFELKTRSMYTMRGKPDFNDVIQANFGKILNPEEFSYQIWKYGVGSNPPDIINKLFLLNYDDTKDDKLKLHLLQHMTVNLPTARPTLAECLNHPYFDDIREEKFPEIKYIDILNNLPQYKVQGSRYLRDEESILIKFNGFARMALVGRRIKIKNLKCYFVAFSLFNRYISKVEVDSQRMERISLACLMIANELTRTLVPNRLMPQFYKFIPGYTEDEACSDFVEVLKELNMELVQSIPILYFPYVNTEIIISLLLYECNTNQLFTPLDVAKFICFKLGLKIIPGTINGISAISFDGQLSIINETISNSRNNIRDITDILENFSYDSATSQADLRDHNYDDQFERLFEKQWKGLLDYEKLPDGTERWSREGVLHRDGGPALKGGKDETGFEEWYQNGVLHRGDGKPAISRNGGEYEEYWENGKRHRKGGPAIHSDSIEEYWENGIRIK